MKKFFLSVLTVCLALVCLSMTAQNSTPQPQKPSTQPPASSPPAISAQPGDVDTVDHIVAAVYDVISGPAGQRDWDRFRSLTIPARA